MTPATRLDLGCGASKKEGFLGVDGLALEGVDQVHDLNQFPYPFEESSIEEIWMDQVLEHLDEPLKVIEELHRICKNGAVVHIGVPYFRSFYQAIDPTHKNQFSVFSFAYFDPDHPFCTRYAYSPARFKVLKREFDRENKQGALGLLRRMVINLAEAKPELYEARLSHLYPLDSLTFTLEVLKP